MQKLELRKLVRQRFANYSQEQLATMSRLTISILEQHPLFLKAQKVLLFHSLPDEVDTHHLIQHYRTEKTIYLPTVVEDRLELHEVNDKGLLKGKFGILESSGPTLTDYSQLDLAVIPGVAFNQEGHRLGRGRGYYDRLLPLLPCPCIGICYPFQIAQQIPIEAHDIPVQEVVFLPKFSSM